MERILPSRYEVKAITYVQKSQESVNILLELSKLLLSV